MGAGQPLQTQALAQSITCTLATSRSEQAAAGALAQKTAATGIPTRTDPRTGLMGCHIGGGAKSELASTHACTRAVASDTTGVSTGVSDCTGTVAGALASEHRRTRRLDAGAGARSGTDTGAALALAQAQARGQGQAQELAQAQAETRTRARTRAHVRQAGVPGPSR